MNERRSWLNKFDALSLMHWEDGLPPNGVDVTLRLSDAGVQTAREVVKAGLKLFAHAGEILVGHVASAVDLEHVATLPCVKEVQLSQPLYQEHPR